MGLRALQEIKKGGPEGPRGGWVVLFGVSVDDREEALVEVVAGVGEGVLLLGGLEVLTEGGGILVHLVASVGLRVGALRVGHEGDLGVVGKGGSGDDVLVHDVSLWLRE